MSKIETAVYVLFTAAAIPSHFHIEIPIAVAMRDAGHDVAFATAPNLVPRIERLGMTAFAVGPSHSSGTPPPSDPGQRLIWAFEEFFFGPPAAERLTDLLEHCVRQPPDLIVRESAEFAGCIAAEALNKPHAVIQNGNISAYYKLPRQLVQQRLSSLRASHGLSADLDLAMVYRYLLFLLVPRSFHDPSIALPATAHFLRPLIFDGAGEEGLPAWLDSLPPRPTVYMTLGTVYNARVDLFSMVIEALRHEPLNLIITVGRDQDPAQFGPQPSHIKIDRYIPQSLLLPRCDAMINCGGMNSLRTAFEHAVPLVLLPLGADHPMNASRCAAMGVARVLDPRTATPETIREAVHTVLSDKTYRTNANQVQRDLIDMPGPKRAVELLQELATARAPIVQSSA